MGRMLGFEGVDAVLFDFDGVLVDSEPLSEAAWRETLGEFGVELDDFSEWVGKTDQALALHFSQELGVSPSRLLERSSEVLLTRVKEEPVQPFEDALETLERAESVRMPVAVVSNSETWRLEALLRSSRLDTRFQVRVSSDDVARPKPDPDVYLRAAHLLGVPAARSLAIEDSPTGVAAARDAGMRVVAVDRGWFGRDSLAHATRVVDRLEVDS